MYKTNFKRKPNKITLLSHLWNNILADLELINLGFRKDKITHSLLAQIREVPEHGRNALFKEYLKKC